jgi:hypothetical protein
VKIRETGIPVPAAVAAILASAATMLVLDLAWLGVVSRGPYASALGPLPTGRDVPDRRDGAL